MIAGKYPSMLEKLCAIMVGVTLNCLFVREASSMAVRSPIMVTNKAASLSRGGIVIMGVFVGKKFVVIMSPATMLPQANRLMGLITV